MDLKQVCGRPAEYVGGNRHGTYCSLRAESPYPDIQGLWPSGPALVRIEYDMLQYHKTPKSQWLNRTKIYLSLIKSLVLARWPSSIQWLRDPGCYILWFCHLDTWSPALLFQVEGRTRGGICVPTCLSHEVVPTSLSVRIVTGYQLKPKGAWKIEPSVSQEKDTVYLSLCLRSRS